MMVSVSTTVASRTTSRTRKNHQHQQQPYATTTATTATPHRGRRCIGQWLKENQYTINLTKNEEGIEDEGEDHERQNQQKRNPILSALGNSTACVASDDSSSRKTRQQQSNNDKDNDNDNKYYHVTVILSSSSSRQDDDDDDDDDVTSLVAGLISARKFKVTILSLTTKEGRHHQEEVERTVTMQNRIRILEHLETIDEELFHRLFTYVELSLPATTTTTTTTTATTPFDNTAIQEAPSIFHALQEYYLDHLH
jgi:hypothetical protein